MSSQDLACYIKERLKTLRVSVTQAAERSGISRQTWHKLLGGDIVEARLTTLIKIADTLHVHPLSLLRIYFYGVPLNHASSIASGSRNIASGFIADITYPDNSIVHVGQVFDKTWEVINLGTQPWEGWRLQCIDDYLEVQPRPGCEDYTCQTTTRYGLLPLADSIPIPTTQPGEKVRLTVTFRAPDFPCTAISHWKSVDSNGQLLFPKLNGLYCLVKVVSL